MRRGTPGPQASKDQPPPTTVGKGVPPEASTREVLVTASAHPRLSLGPAVRYSSVRHPFFSFVVLFKRCRRWYRILNRKTNGVEAEGSDAHRAEVRRPLGDVPSSGRAQVEWSGDRRGDGWYRDALLRHQPEEGQDREPWLREIEGHSQGHGLPSGIVVRGESRLQDGGFYRPRSWALEPRRKSEPPLRSNKERDDGRILHERRSIPHEPGRPERRARRADQGGRPD